MNSTLSDSLSQLFKFLEKKGLTPPVTEVRIIEIGHPMVMDERTRYIVPKDSLRTPLEYAARFEKITHSGLAWVNLSCYGVYRELLLVGIELQNEALGPYSSKPTSINYSGPPNIVIQHGWDSSEALVIV
jgi:hypothetical protein